MARSQVRTPLLLIFLLAAGIHAQTPGTVQANGSATMNVSPDQATLSVGVVTQATTAQDAAQQNAAQATNMIKALTSVLGSNGSIQTINYSITPNYSTSAQAATIIGYTASNTVQVITTNLNLVGSLIDAANQAGANRVNGPSFGLQNPDPFVQQALTQATKQGLAHAGAIAAGLGLKTGAVVSAQEGGSVTPVLAAPGATSSTPIQTGTVTVSGYVTITVALVQGQ
jgi:uncharacterized protein YggE